jgi:hypothetical protein
VQAAAVTLVSVSAQASNADLVCAGARRASCAVTLCVLSEARFTEQGWDRARTGVLPVGGIEHGAQPLQIPGHRPSAYGVMYHDGSVRVWGLAGGLRRGMRET